MNIITLQIQKTAIPLCQEVQASLGCSHEGCRRDYTSLIVEETMEGIKVHNYCEVHSNEFKETVNQNVRDIIEKLQGLIGQGIPGDLKNLFKKNDDDKLGGRAK